MAVVSASDRDAGETLTYSLSETAGGRFVIDPESGQITLREGAHLEPRDRAQPTNCVCA